MMWAWARVVVIGGENYLGSGYILKAASRFADKSDLGFAREKSRRASRLPLERSCR